MTTFYRVSVEETNKEIYVVPARDERDARLSTAILLHAKIGKLAEKYSKEYNKKRKDKDIDTYIRMSNLVNQIRELQILLDSNYKVEEVDL